MISFRKSQPALVKGALTVLDARDDMIVFSRVHKGEELACAFNLSDHETHVTLPGDGWTNVEGAPMQAALSGRDISLDAWQASFARRTV